MNSLEGFKTLAKTGNFSKEIKDSIAKAKTVQEVIDIIKTTEEFKKVYKQLKK